MRVEKARLRFAKNVYLECVSSRWQIGLGLTSFDSALNQPPSSCDSFCRFEDGTYPVPTSMTQAGRRPSMIWASPKTYPGETHLCRDDWSRLTIKKSPLNQRQQIPTTPFATHIYRSVLFRCTANQTTAAASCDRIFSAHFNLKRDTWISHFSISPYISLYLNSLNYYHITRAYNRKTYLKLSFFF